MWLSYVIFGIKADFRSIQHNRRQPLESKTIKRASEPNMTIPFKFLPHEILNKPKPAPAIHIYPSSPTWVFHPQANKEASDASQANDQHSCPPLITEPTTYKPPKKKKKTHASPLATNCQDPQINSQPPVTDTIFTLHHRRCQDLRQAATTPPQFEPPLSALSSCRHSRRSQAPHVHRRAIFFSLEIMLSLLVSMVFF